MSIRTREYKVQGSEDVRVRHGIPNEASAGCQWLYLVVVCQGFSSSSTCNPFVPQSV